MKATLILPVLLACCLGGCTGMHSDFSCSRTAHGGCLSVTEVNARAEAGLYDHPLPVIRRIGSRHHA